MAAVWDIERGCGLQRLKWHSGWVWGLAFEEQSGCLVTASVDHSIRAMDLNTKKVISVMLDHQFEVAGLCADWNRRFIVSASFGGEVKVHDMRTWKCVNTITAHHDRCTRVCCDSDNIYSASFDNSARRWNFAHGL